MKKYVYISLLLVMGIVNIQPLTALSSNELQISIGYESNFFFIDNNDKVNIYKVGFDIRAYDFWNENNIGLFHKLGIFPSIDPINFFPYNVKFGASSILGIGFRKILNDNMTLQFGLGLNEIAYASGPEERFQFGLGGEVMYKYNFSERFFICTGVDLTNDFNMDLSTDKKNHNIFGIQPFLNIGMNFLWNKK